MGTRSGLHRLHWLKRLIYRDGRPSALAQRLNGFWGRRYAAGGRLARARDVELRVVGRSSGREIGFPAVLADIDGRWYAVSMLGDSANWVRNVRAAAGRATIRHGGSWEVELVEVPVDRRAPILQRYLEVAPGARPHFAVDRTAPLAEFEAIAADHPAFEVRGFTPADPD